MAKKSKGEVFKTFSEAEYQQVMQELVHYSAKSINSNAFAVGVRLGQDDAWNGKYVAVSTLLAQSNLVVDYQKNAGNIATILKQIAAVCYDENGEIFEEIPPEQAEMIKALQQRVLRQFYFSKQTRVPIRLRQIIVQNQAGEDIVLTPLQSASFSKLLQEKLRAEDRFRLRGFLDLGGSNKQNVGRYVRDMTRPLFFQAPQEDSQLRQALAIYYRGISLRPSRKLLTEYYQWRAPLVKALGGAMPSDLTLRETEREKIQGIIQIIMERAQTAQKLLKTHQDALPDQALTSTSLEPLQRALLDENQRYANWTRDVAKAIHQEILNSEIWVQGHWQHFPLGEQETLRWLEIIEEKLCATNI